MTDMHAWRRFEYHMLKRGWEWGLQNGVMFRKHNGHDEAFDVLHGTQFRHVDAKWVKVAQHDGDWQGMLAAFDAGEEPLP